MGGRPHPSQAARGGSDDRLTQFRTRATWTPPGDVPPPGLPPEVPEPPSEPPTGPPQDPPAQPPGGPDETPDAPPVEFPEGRAHMEGRARTVAAQLQGVGASLASWTRPSAPTNAHS